MKAQRKSKPVQHARGFSSAAVSRRTRSVIRTVRPAPRRQPAGLNNPLVAPDHRFRTARGLMICLGWLRLFQTIVAGIPSARKPISHET